MQHHMLLDDLTFKQPTRNVAMLPVQVSMRDSGYRQLTPGFGSPSTHPTRLFHKANRWGNSSAENSRLNWWPRCATRSAQPTVDSFWKHLLNFQGCRSPLKSARSPPIYGGLLAVYCNRTKLANRLEDAAQGLSHLIPLVGPT